MPNDREPINNLATGKERYIDRSGGEHWCLGSVQPPTAQMHPHLPSPPLAMTWRAAILSSQVLNIIAVFTIFTFVIL